jgi:hypothetical protein
MRFMYFLCIWRMEWWWDFGSIVTAAFLFSLYKIQWMPAGRIKRSGGIFVLLLMHSYSSYILRFFRLGAPGDSRDFLSPVTRFQSGQYSSVTSADRYPKKLTRRSVLTHSETLASPVSIDEMSKTPHIPIEMDGVAVRTPIPPHIYIHGNDTRNLCTKVSAHFPQVELAFQAATSARRFHGVLRS